jgi:hypothetical protein
MRARSRRNAWWCGPPRYGPADLGLAALQRLLGHGHLSTTQIYLNLSPEEVISEFHRKCTTAARWNTRSRSPRTTKLYNRTSDQTTLDEIERIAI